MQAQGYGHLVSDKKESCENTSNVFGSIILEGTDYMQACQGSSAVAILTEWDIFKAYDYTSIAQVMSAPKTVYDFRGILPCNVLSKEDSPFEKSFQIGVGWLKESSD